LGSGRKNCALLANQRAQFLGQRAYNPRINSSSRASSDVRGDTESSLRLRPPHVSTPHHPARINLKLRDLAQLFNSMDPSPFLDRDLDHDAEEFIVSWARELPKSHGFELVIHLPAPPQTETAADVESAVQHYFTNRAEIKQREFRLLLQRGHASLSIGLIFLTACLLASGLVGQLGHESAARVIREGLIIVGWVAMWRPLETYLYDWWPARAEWHIQQRLSRMRVRLIFPHATDAHPSAPGSSQRSSA
jgi:hypothetical protein